MKGFLRLFQFQEPRVQGTVHRGDKIRTREQLFENQHICPGCPFKKLDVFGAIHEEDILIQKAQKVPETGSDKFEDFQ